MFGCTINDVVLAVTVERSRDWLPRARRGARPAARRVVPGVDRRWSDRARRLRRQPDVVAVRVAAGPARRPVARIHFVRQNTKDAEEELHRARSVPRRSCRQAAEAAPPALANIAARLYTSDRSARPAPGCAEPGGVEQLPARPSRCTARAHTCSPPTRWVRSSKVPGWNLTVLSNMGNMDIRGDHACRELMPQCVVDRRRLRAPRPGASRRSRSDRRDGRDREGLTLRHRSVIVVAGGDPSGTATALDDLPTEAAVIAADSVSTSPSRPDRAARQRRGGRLRLGAARHARRARGRRCCPHRPPPFGEGHDRPRAGTRGSARARRRARGRARRSWRAARPPARECAAARLAHRSRISTSRPGWATRTSSCAGPVPPAVLRGREGDLVSLLAAHGPADGVTTEGLRYPLPGGPLRTWLDPRGEQRDGGGGGTGRHRSRHPAGRATRRIGRRLTDAITARSPVRALRGTSQTA